MAMNVHGKRRKYAYFMVSDHAREIRAELPYLWSALSEESMGSVIESTPGIDDLHRDFYRCTLEARRRYVLEPALELAMSERRPAHGALGYDGPGIADLPEPDIVSGPLDANGPGSDARIFPNM